MPGGVDSKGRSWKSETFPAFSMPSPARHRAAGRVPRDQSSQTSRPGMKAAERDLSIDDEFAQCYPGEVAFDEYSLLVMFKDASGQPLSDTTLASLASAQEQIAALSEYQVGGVLFFLSLSIGRNMALTLYLVCLLHECFALMTFRRVAERKKTDRVRLRTLWLTGPLSRRRPWTTILQ